MSGRQLTMNIHITVLGVYQMAYMEDPYHYNIAIHYCHMSDMQANYNEYPYNCIKYALDVHNSSFCLAWLYIYTITMSFVTIQLKGYV